MKLLKIIVPGVFTPEVHVCVGVCGCVCVGVCGCVGGCVWVCVCVCVHCAAWWSGVCICILLWTVYYQYDTLLSLNLDWFSDHGGCHAGFENRGRRLDDSKRHGH